MGIGCPGPDGLSRPGDIRRVSAAHRVECGDDPEVAMLLLKIENTVRAFGEIGRGVGTDASPREMSTSVKRNEIEG